MTGMIYTNFVSDYFQGFTVTSGEDLFQLDNKTPILHWRYKSGSVDFQVHD